MRALQTRPSCIMTVMVSAGRRLKQFVTDAMASTSVAQILDNFASQTNTCYLLITVYTFTDMQA